MRGGIPSRRCSELWRKPFQRIRRMAELQYLLVGNPLPKSVDETEDVPNEVTYYYRRPPQLLPRFELINQLSYASTYIEPHTNETADETLVAQCYCRTVTLLISRPDVPSSYPPETWNTWAEALDPPPHNPHAHPHSYLSGYNCSKIR